MEYRAWINKRIEARSKVVVVMKEYFFKEDKYPSVALKMASWLSKLVHEGKKCWPDMEEWDVCEWLSKQNSDDLMEMIKNPDDRPRDKMFPMAKELIKYLPSNTKEGERCETTTGSVTPKNNENGT